MFTISGSQKRVLGNLLKKEKIIIKKKVRD